MLQELAAFNLLVEVLYFGVLLLDYCLFRCHLRLDLKINKRVKNFQNVGTHLVERLALFLDFVLKHLLLRLQIHLQLLDGVLLDLLHFDVVHGHTAPGSPVTLVACVGGGVHRRLDHLVDTALHETVVLVPDVDVARVVPLRFLQGFLQPLLHHFLEGLVLFQGARKSDQRIRVALFLEPLDFLFQLLDLQFGVVIRSRCSRFLIQIVFVLQFFVPLEQRFHHFFSHDQALFHVLLAQIFHFALEVVLGI